MGLSLGAFLGFGANVGADIDFSFWTDKFKGWIAKKLYYEKKMR